MTLFEERALRLQAEGYRAAEIRLGGRDPATFVSAQAASKAAFADHLSRTTPPKGMR